MVINRMGDDVVGGNEDAVYKAGSGEDKDEGEFRDGDGEGGNKAHGGAERGEGEVRDDDAAGITGNLPANGERTDGDENSNSNADQQMGEGGVSLRDHADRDGVGGHTDTGNEENMDMDRDGDAVQKAGGGKGNEENMDVDGDAVHKAGGGKGKEDESGIQEEMNVDEDGVDEEESCRRISRRPHTLSNLSKSLLSTVTPVRPRALPGPSFQQFKTRKRRAYSSRIPRKAKHPASTNQAASSQQAKQKSPSDAYNVYTLNGTPVVDDKLKILNVCITPHYLFFNYIQPNFQKSAPTVTLQDSDAEEVHLGDEMTVYDIEGNPHTFTPRLNVCSLVLVL
jgi:hypothetical protein